MKPPFKVEVMTLTGMAAPEEHSSFEAAVLRAAALNWSEDYCGRVVCGDGFSFSPHMGDPWWWN